MSRAAVAGLGLDISRTCRRYRLRLLGGSAVIEVRRASWQQLLEADVPLLGLLLLLFAVTFLVTPDMSISALGLRLPAIFVCPFFFVTGIPGLLCGMTRSFLAMGGFDLRGAFAYHPLGPPLYLSLLALTALLAASILRRRQVRVRFSPVLWRQLVRYGMILLLAAWAVKVAVWNDVGLI